MDTLQKIRDLQFTNKAGAEALLLPFIQNLFPLDVISVELRPLAISLNSFNGFLTLADGQQLFFKSHTESDTVIGEYYRAEALADAGYPVIQPTYSSQEPGKQLLIYEVIEAPAVFDVAWAIEQGRSEEFGALSDAQNRADDALLNLYHATLQPQNAEEAAKAPIHQLFYHRLTGGRLARFYGKSHSGEKSIQLLNEVYDIRKVRQVKWIINGQKYDESLDDIIERAVKLLNPMQAGYSITGHGDAHNGNVFFQSDTLSLLYFDPAFAGNHHPLLDLTKPLFHNVFAMWMYFPEIKAQQTRISMQTDGGYWYVDYQYELPSIRQLFLESKVQRVLIPILRHLKSSDILRPDWRSFLKAALFCCPFLTMDLSDHEKFPPAISLLGLAMSVEMGAESNNKRSRIDHVLDEVEEQLL